MPAAKRLAPLWLTLFCLCAANAAFGEIVLTTDKPVYTIGEVVHLEATNNGPLTEQFLSAPYFLIFNTDTDECVFGCVGLPVITPFPVGQTVTMDWDTGILPDAPGNYVVGLAATNSPTESYVLTDAVTVEPRSWGMMKATYR